MIDARLQHGINTSSTISEDTFSKINKWLEYCDSNHTSCQEYAQKGDLNWYPTRLIDISGWAQEVTAVTGVPCKIVKGTTVPLGQRYITVSHRWGTSNVARLTASNLSSWMAEVPTAVLSKTFQDCFDTAKRLGVHYVWIDSFCIIQEGDDLVDWKSEAAKMYQVYTYAWMNIAASWGAEGLFAPRDPRELDPPILNVRLRTSTESKSKIPGKRDHEQIVPSVLFDAGSWGREVTESPLVTRAWVVQERLLSRRNLYFGRNEALFECWDAIWSESSPASFRTIYDFETDDVHSGVGDFHTMFKHVPMDLERGRIPGKPTSALLFKSWERIATEYSRRQLTFGSDKLIAMIGMAKFFKSLMPTEIYVVGLWLSRLTLDMAWYCNSEYNSSRSTFSDTTNTSAQSATNMSHMDHYRAPSFTWASVDSSIGWRSGVHGKWAENSATAYIERIILPSVGIIKYRAAVSPQIEEAVTTDIFGPMLAPAIEAKVVGHLKRITLRYHIQDGIGVVSRGPWSFQGDGFVHLDRQLRDSELAALEARELFFMPWCSGFDGTWKETEGLLLEIVDTKMGRFRRIGMHYFRQGTRGLPGDEEVSAQQEDPEELKKHISTSYKAEDFTYSSTYDESSLPCWGYDVASRRHTIFLI